MKIRKVQFVNSAGTAWPWYRQFPNDDGIWEGTQYALDKSMEKEPDWLVVYEGWPVGDFLTCVPKERRIFIMGEPESFHRYQPRFLDQFGHVITTQRVVRHPGVILSQVAINWFVGVRFNGQYGPHTAALRFTDFAAGNPPKTKLCSVVCSTKAVTPGHRRRLEFVKRLKSELGDKVDIFGRGFRDIDDKDVALADYRFHISLENSVHPDYWTEKLADPFLRGCFPIYSGCQNVADYFPTGSYVKINLNRPGAAIVRIKEVLGGHLDRENSLVLAEAKRRVLWEYNVFALLQRVYCKLEQFERPELKGGIETKLISDSEAKNMLFRRRFVKKLRQFVCR